MDILSQGDGKLFTDPSANNISANAANVPRNAVDPASGKNLGGHVLDQYGTVLNGPVILPHLYNGKDKTFWMFGFENYREIAPMVTLSSVPSNSERQGDFSGAGINIYNPFSTQVNPNFNAGAGNSASNPQYIRQPFPGNIIPSNLWNAAGLAILAIFGYMLLKCERSERAGLVAALILTAQVILFFVFYVQMSTSLTLFALRNVDVEWKLLGFDMWPWSPGQYQALNPIWIMLLSPILAWTYTHFGKTGRDLPIAAKFALGFVVVAVGFFIFGVSGGTAVQGKVSSWYMIWGYGFYSLGELLVSGLGLAMIARYVPARMGGRYELRPGAFRINFNRGEELEGCKRILLLVCHRIASVDVSNERVEVLSADGRLFDLRVEF